MTGGLLIRAPFFHTVANPFHGVAALHSESDGGLLIQDGLIAASGTFTAVRQQAASVDVLDWSGSLMSGYRTQFEIFRNSEKVASLPLEHRENATTNAGQQLTEAIARAFA